MLSTDLQLALNAAIREAQVRRHEYVTVEHVLFSLIHDDRGAQVLEEWTQNKRGWILRQSAFK